jgi:sirohydrochlorin cobaltochelatase
MKRGFAASLLVMALVFSVATFSFASGGGHKIEHKTAIILASFGTTVPEAVAAITNIQEKIKAAYPGVPVKVTFTSNIIRSVWKERQAEAQKWLDQGIPEEILYVKNIIATFGDLREEGYTDIVVQPTHMFFMEQSHDLASYVNAMRSIRTIKPHWMPFQKIALGRPALGTVGAQYDYHEDVAKAMESLAADAKMAKEKGAMLVYMGHGNDYWPTSIYGEAAKKMRELHPDLVTYIGVVEGYPGIDDVVRYMSHYDGGKIILKPFMIVAGDHAVNDMAGADEESWESVLKAKGFEVESVLKGLGRNDAFAQIFVDHIKDAAKDAGIELK